MENDEQNYYLPESEGIDFRRYFSLFISNWYWFAAALFLTLAIAYGVNRWGEEVYTVQSTMLIKDEENGGGYAEMDKIIPGGDIFGTRQNLQNEIGILKSFGLNHQVMYSLRISMLFIRRWGSGVLPKAACTGTHPSLSICDSIWIQPAGKRVDIKILSPEKYLLTIEADEYEGEHSFGEQFSKFGFDFIIHPRNPGVSPYIEGGSNKYYFYIAISAGPGQHATAPSLSVSPIEEEATLVTLTVTGLVPEQEAEYLNTLMDAYIASGTAVEE